MPEFEKEVEKDEERTVAELIQDYKRVHERSIRRAVELEERQG